MYDVAIVGGGPAGSTLARLIGKVYKVLLLERRILCNNLNVANHKCCGGLIAPDAQKILASFGMGLPAPVILSPQIFAVRSIDINNNLERFYQRHYINIDRQEFDKWLLSLVPASVDIINGGVYKTHYEKDGYVYIKYSKGKKEFEEKVKLLVGADGANSKVRRNSFVDKKTPEQYISVQEWFKTDTNLSYYGAIFDSEITDFYSWTIPKGEYIILGSALKPNDRVIQKFGLLKEKLKNFGFDFRNSTRVNGAYLSRPKRCDQLLIGAGRVALIGEAGGFISPSSAEGFSYAFRSSLELSKALNNGIEGWHALYIKNISGLVRNIRLKNYKAVFMYNKFLRKTVMKSGVISVKMENECKNANVL